MIRRRRQQIRMPSLQPKPEISHGMRRLAGLLVFTLGVGLLADALRSLIVEDATLRTMVWLGAFFLPAGFADDQIGRRDAATNRLSLRASCWLSGGSPGCQGAVAMSYWRETRPATRILLGGVWTRWTSSAA